jgi:hypothetical protein
MEELKKLNNKQACKSLKTAIIKLSDELGLDTESVKYDIEKTENSAKSFLNIGVFCLI